MIDENKLLEILRSRIISPDVQDQNRQIWQIAQSNFAAFLYGAIMMGELDIDDEREEAKGLK